MEKIYDIFDILDLFLDAYVDAELVFKLFILKISKFT